MSTNASVNFKLLHDLDLSNIYNNPREPNLVTDIQKTDNLPLAIITLVIQQNPVTSRLRVFDKWRRWRAKSRTDRDPTQFGHTCPGPGRTLPEVTISWTAQGCTGCTRLGGTWQSGAPQLHESYRLQDWVKTYNWGSDLLELKRWFLSY